MAEEERTLNIPMLYVDAAEVHTFPHTVQILLGSTTPNGVMPRVQLALAPGFAMQLLESLQQALADYRAAAPTDEDGAK